MEGVSNTKVDIISKEMTTEQIDEFSKKAIDDAKQKAQEITSKLGKEVGEIISIENTEYRYDY